MIGADRLTSLFGGGGGGGADCVGKRPGAANTSDVGCFVGAAADCNSTSDHVCPVAPSFSRWASVADGMA